MKDVVVQAAGNLSAADGRKAVVRFKKRVEVCMHNQRCHFELELYEYIFLAHNNKMSIITEYFSNLGIPKYYQYFDVGGRLK